MGLDSVVNQEYDAPLLADFRRVANNPITLDVVPKSDISVLRLAFASEDRVWQDDAACVGSPRYFYGPPAEKMESKDQRESAAKKICSTCSVRIPCLDYAKENREYGIWGGTNEDERQFATGVVIDGFRKISEKKRHQILNDDR